MEKIRIYFARFEFEADPKLEEALIVVSKKGWNLKNRRTGELVTQETLLNTELGDIFAVLDNEGNEEEIYVDPKTSDIWVIKGYSYESDGGYYEQYPAKEQRFLTLDQAVQRRDSHRDFRSQYFQ